MREIHRILCPVDLSDMSNHAVEHAVALGRWYHARLTALHVCNPIVVPATDFAMVGWAPPPELTEDESREVRQQIATTFAAANPETAVDVLVQSGQAAKQIVAAAESLPADLVVIGTHGHSGFQHLVLGSVTEKVLRQATCPVLIVPPRGQASRLPFTRILCPVDFSESSLAALDFARSIAQHCGAELTLLHVFEWPDEPLTTRPIATPEFRRSLEREADERLHSLAPGAIHSSYRTLTRVAHGKAYREILRAASDDAVDLLVIGVQGRNALDLMLFGSTTNQVVRRAMCPVLTLRG